MEVLNMSDLVRLVYAESYEKAKFEKTKYNMLNERVAVIYPTCPQKEVEAAKRLLFEHKRKCKLRKTARDNNVVVAKLTYNGNLEGYRFKINNMLFDLTADEFNEHFFGGVRISDKELKMKLVGDLLVTQKEEQGQIQVGDLNALMQYLDSQMQQQKAQ